MSGLSLSRMLRQVAGTLVIVAFLAGLSGAEPPAAGAIPPEPGGSCIPQPVTAKDAELLGSLRLLDAAVVGLESRISMADASLRFPDPTCDGRYISVALTYRWAITARPADSTASLTQTTTLTPRLVPDRAGAWAVSFTACPAGCRVAGTTFTIPPQTRTLNFTANDGAEGRMSSAELADMVKIVLRDTHIQISHTGAGTTVAGTPYTLRWTIPYTKYQQLCVDPENDNDPQTNPAPICAQWEKEGLSGQETFHTFTPQLSSYIDFGTAAEAAGAPLVLALPIEAYEHEIPTWKRAAFLALQNAPGIVVGTDIDRVRLLANNLFQFLVNPEFYPTSIGGGGINVGVKLDSNHPSIKCEGHFQVKAGYVFTLSEGWADELCPDFDLSQIDLSVKLVPGVVNGALTLLDAQVTAQLAPQGVQSELIDVLFDATDKAETKIATKLRDRLLEPQTRTDLGKVLTAVLKSKFKDLCRIVSAQVVGTDWVVRYEATSPVVNSCAGPGVNTTGS